MGSVKTEYTQRYLACQDVKKSIWWR